MENSFTLNSSLPPHPCPKLKIHLPLCGLPLLLKDRQCADLLNISRASWWAKVKEGKCPQPIKLSSKITRWCSEEVIRLFSENGDLPKNYIGAEYLPLVFETSRVLEELGISYFTLLSGVRSGDFPSPFKLAFTENDRWQTKDWIELIANIKAARGH